MSASPRDANLADGPQVAHPVRESRPGAVLSMLGYFALLGAALGGLGGMPVWVVAVSAIALALLSYAQHEALYLKANASGFSRMVDLTLLRSAFNALVAASASYGGGYLLHLL